MWLGRDRPVDVGIDMAVEWLDIACAEPAAKFIRNPWSTGKAQYELEIGETFRANVGNCLSRPDLRQGDRSIEIVKRRKCVAFRQDQFRCCDGVGTVGGDDCCIAVTNI